MDATSATVAFHFILLALLICAYAFIFFVMLRDERGALTVLGLVLVGAAAAGLRLVFLHDFPPGYNEDEPKLLMDVIPRFRGEWPLMAMSLNGFPTLLHALTMGALSSLGASGRWAMRGYSVACGILACPAAFAVARAMRCRVVPSLFAAACFAVLPWTLLYSRTAIGAELYLHELIVLWALARLIWCEGGLVEACVGAFALVLAVHDYVAMRAVVYMVLAATVLMPRRRRWCPPFMAAVALLSNLPMMLGGEPLAFGGFGFVYTGLGTEHIVIGDRILQALDSLYEPTASDFWMSLAGAAVHPPVLLGLAALGVVLAGLRRSLLLLCVFGIGLVPVVVGAHAPVSSHRMIPALTIIPLAAACGLNWFRSAVAVPAAAIAVCLVATFSVPYYFSPALWTPESVWIYCNYGCARTPSDPIRGLPLHYYGHTWPD